MSVTIRQAAQVTQALSVLNKRCRQAAVAPIRIARLDVSVTPKQCYNIFKLDVNINILYLLG